MNLVIALAIAFVAAYFGVWLAVMFDKFVTKRGYRGWHIDD